MSRVTSVESFRDIPAKDRGDISLKLSFHRVANPKLEVFNCLLRALSIPGASGGSRDGGSSVFLREFSRLAGHVYGGIAAMPRTVHGPSTGSLAPYSSRTRHGPFTESPGHAPDSPRILHGKPRPGQSPDGITGHQ